MEIGQVRDWNDEEGWGVLDSAGTPGGCFVHMGSIRMEGYRTLRPGATVHFESEPARQDGYDFFATAGPFSTMACRWPGVEYPALPANPKPG